MNDKAKSLSLVVDAAIVGTLGAAAAWTFKELQKNGVARAKELEELEKKGFNVVQQPEIVGKIEEKESKGKPKRASSKEESMKISQASQAVQAASEGDLEALEDLIKQGVDINSYDYDRKTPLHLACINGQQKAVEWLIKNGAYLHPPDRNGVTPLMEAIRLGFTEIARMLKETVVSDLKFTAWNSENDQAVMVLYSDPRRWNNALSFHTGDLSSKDTEFNTQVFHQALIEKGVDIVSIQDIVFAFAGEPGFDDLLLSQIECISTHESITQDQTLQFKKSLIQGMSMEQLIQTATHKTVVKLTISDEGVLVAHSVQIEPLVDVFQSRLQICSPKGAVLVGNDKNRFKTNLLKFIFHKLGLKVLKSLPDPLTFSGGDYIPVGPHLAFMGTGIDTDEAAVRWLMRKHFFGTPRVAVVRDLFDRDPARRTLDTVMKILDTNVVGVLDILLEKDNLRRRIVDEYILTDKGYQLHNMNLDFEQYLKSMNFNIIKLEFKDFKDIGLPLFNTGHGSLFSLDSKLESTLKSNALFTGSIKLLDFTGQQSKFDFLHKNCFVFRKATGKSFPAPPALPEKILRPWDTHEEAAPAQTTHTVLMVAPVGFQTNIETFQDNYFMQKVMSSALEIEKKALLEFSGLLKELYRAGVKVFLQCSERFHNTPDAVFPNNWFSTHTKSELGVSTVVFYPMKTPSRRNERREHIISEFQNVYSREITFVQWENSDFPHYLESTGVLIMDHVRKIAYATLSQRCNKHICHIWARRMGYELCLFHSTDAQGRPIYHTNVMMAVGTSCAVLCAESIDSAEERREVLRKLGESHEVIEITREQVNNFCGNVLELKSTSGRKLMVMSSRAYQHFTEQQKKTFLKHVDEIVHADIQTIETVGGGGVRCMLGEIF